MENRQLILTIALAAFALTQTFADGILSVSPASATVGTSGLLLTVELDSGALPPLPPSEIAPSIPTMDKAQNKHHSPCSLSETIS